jgi:ribosome-associated protein
MARCSLAGTPLAIERSGSFRRFNSFAGTLMLPINDVLSIPDDELSFTYARSGGPGGQNVNKVSSKAVLRWALAASPSVTPAVKERIARLERKRVTTEGDLVIASQRFRDQERNREDCLERLREIVLRALVVPKVRRPTKPTKGSKRRRLEEKKRRSETKQGRRGVGE